MNELLSYKLRTLFEQLRIEGKSRGGDIRLNLQQQEEILREVYELEEALSNAYEEEDI